MSYRPRLVLVLSLLILLSLTLSACNRERPAATTTTPTAGRGTVAAPTVAPVGTQVAAPTATGEASAMPTPSAPAPQQVVVSPAAPGTGGNAQTFTYTVVAGDTLATIASRFGTTQDAIAQLNSLADPNSLQPGQKLQIPGTGAGAGTGAAAGGATSGGATSGGATTGGATSGGTGTYTVQSGDTLTKIAQRFGTTVAELQRLNPSLTNPDVLALGQTLVVPGGAGASSGGAITAPAGGQSKTYVVQRGDTLMSIAKRFGLTLKDLQTANNITNPDKIYPGQKLVIP